MDSQPWTTFYDIIYPTLQATVQIVQIVHHLGNIIVLRRSNYSLVLTRYHDGGLRHNLRRTSLRRSPPLTVPPLGRTEMQQKPSWRALKGDLLVLATTVAAKRSNAVEV